MVADGNRLKEDANIIYDKRTNKFHFIYTFEAPKLEDPDPGFLNKRVVATDPGIKAFQTWYSPTTGRTANCSAARILSSRRGAYCWTRCTHGWTAAKASEENHTPADVPPSSAAAQHAV
jgi:hypothetical protein